MVFCIAFRPCNANKPNKLHRSRNPRIYLYVTYQNEHQFYLIIHLLLINKPSSFLPFSSPPPATGAAIVPEISIVEDQGQVVGIITVIFSGDADTRTPFKGGEKSSCNTIDEPHSHPIELSAPGWGMGGWGSGPGLIRSWPEIE